MPRACSICTHPKRRWINPAILKGTPLCAIARKYGVTRSALDWHKRKHLGKQLLRVEKQTGKTFLERFEALVTDLEKLSDEAKTVREKIMCIRERRAVLEMAVKLGMEEQRRRGQVTVKDVTPGVLAIIDKEFE